MHALSHPLYSRTHPKLLPSLIILALSWASTTTNALEAGKPSYDTNTLTIIPAAEDMPEPGLELEDPPVAIVEEITADNPLPPSNDPAAEARELSTLRALSVRGGNRINISRAGQFVSISYSNPRMRQGDTLSISLAPKGSRQTTFVSKPITSYGAGPISLVLPIRELANYVGREADITVAIGRGNNRLVYSRPRTISVVATSGKDVAASLNSRYRNTASRCSYSGRNDYPAYYCNGIVIRSVDNGAFDPWLPSPSALQVQGISFSYYRIDSAVTDFYRRAGFIFFPQREALRQGRAVEFECIYAHDAWTFAGERQKHGCGRRTRALTPGDNSSCEAVNATTYQSWVAFTKGLSHISYQCSLSTMNAGQFALSVAVRNLPQSTFPNLQMARWNELVAKIWLANGETLPLNAAQSSTIGTRLPIEAFFYRRNDATSLNDAKTFQRKYKERTNLWVPIVALDLRQVKGYPFTYADTDQAVSR